MSHHKVTSATHLPTLRDVRFCTLVERVGLTVTKSAIDRAFRRAVLADMSPKKRLRILKLTTDFLGDPRIVPIATKECLRDIEQARADWALEMPTLMAVG